MWLFNHLTPPDLRTLRARVTGQITAAGKLVDKHDVMIWRLRLSAIDTLLRLGQLEIKDVVLTDAESLKEVSLNNNAGKMRHRRGLMNIFGRLGKTIFGSAMDEDVQELAHKVDRMADSEQDIMQNEHSMLTIMNATRKYVKENRHDINLLKNKTEYLYRLVIEYERGAYNYLQSIRMLQIERIIDQSIDVMEMISNDLM